MNKLIFEKNEPECFWKIVREGKPLFWHDYICKWSKSSGNWPTPITILDYE